MRLLRVLGGGAVLVYAALVLVSWAFQEWIVFSGTRGTLPEPAAYGVTDGRRVEVVTADTVTLRGWYLPPRGAAGATAPGLLWFVNPGETVASLGPVLRDLRPVGIAVLALDYRGSGESGGKASEAGLYRDAEAAWAYLASRPEIDRARIAVYGRGLGTAPALHVAAERRVRAVVLEAPFTTANALFRRRYWFLPEVVLRLEMDNLNPASRLRAPLLVIHGIDDRVVPIAMGRAVAQAGRARQLYAVAGAGHDDVYAVAGERYRDVLHGFLHAVLGP